MGSLLSIKEKVFKMETYSTKKLHPGIIIAGIVVALIVVILISSKIKSLVGAWKDARDHKSAQAILQAQGVKLSHPQSWYSSRANDLFNAMDSQWYNPFSWGTTDSTVNSVFSQLKNDLDFYALFEAFGIKDGYDLQAWLDGDMNQTEKDIINNSMASAGITQRI